MELTAAGNAPGKSKAISRFSTTAHTKANHQGIKSYSW
jgi:hypothetical protein